MTPQADEEEDRQFRDRIESSELRERNWPPDVAGRRAWMVW